MTTAHHTRATTRRTRLALGALLATGALLVTGCGGDAGAKAGAGSDAAVDPALQKRLPDSIKDSGVLRIGTVTSTTPLTEKPGSEVTGLIPDLAHAMAARLGLEVKFIESPMAAQIAALQSDRVDVTWSAMTSTAEREKSINMVPYIRTASAPLVLEGNPAGIKVAKDLCGKSVGVVRGGNSHLVLEAFQKRECGGDPLKPKLYDKSSDGLVQLQSGKLDAFVGVGIQLKHVAETANGGSTFDFVDQVIDENVMNICTAKDNTELAELIRDTLRKVMDSGEYVKILKKYGGEGDALTKEETEINPVTNS
ncbi:transporter substrate-binding domain-containing protein [Streptomyces sp. NPDC002577]